MNRRGFLQSILAAGVAPAFVGSGVLMPIRAFVLPSFSGLDNLVDALPKVQYDWKSLHDGFAIEETSFVDLPPGILLTWADVERCAKVALKRIPKSELILMNANADRIRLLGAAWKRDMQRSGPAMGTTRVTRR